jgi:hypothetical protein
MLSILAFAVAAASPVAPPADAKAMPACQKLGPTPVHEQKPVRAQKLNELPNADHYLTLLRTEGGCSKPVIVRYDIGGAPKQR